MKKNRKTIFLDRDGVINKDPGGWTEHSYVTHWEYFKFLPNSIEAIKKLNDAGYDIALISNQGGISKGYYSEDKLREINKKMMAELEKKGAKIKKAYYCLHQDSDNCDCKKPKTGLFEKAEKELNIKAQGNFFIGDGKMDVEAAEKMGLKSILVLSGKSDLAGVRDWELKPDYIFDNLSEAVNFILKQKEQK
ncbi:MAG: HAD-IIIA family hydrolase [Candidatus Omnitrophica bacterium]|nr:HAD-IIIA family hydrolase [Candidatus Omnitrophota bacterium]